MHSEYWLGELARSLKNGFFSDTVVLELARVSRDRTVSTEQKAVFRKAAEILKFALEGSRWIDNPRMSEKSSTCASFFGQAVEAITLVSTPEAFAKEIERLTGIANRLTNGEVPSESDIQALRKFFFNAGRSELERTESLMSGDKENSKLRWLAARK